MVDISPEAYASRQQEVLASLALGESEAEPKITFHNLLTATFAGLASTVTASLGRSEATSPDFSESPAGSGDSDARRWREQLKEWTSKVLVRPVHPDADFEAIKLSRLLWLSSAPAKVREASANALRGFPFWPLGEQAASLRSAAPRDEDFAPGANYGSENHSLLYLASGVLYYRFVLSDDRRTQGLDLSWAEDQQFLHYAALQSQRLQRLCLARVRSFRELGWSEVNAPVYSLLTVSALLALYDFGPVDFREPCDLALHMICEALLLCTDTAGRCISASPRATGGAKSMSRGRRALDGFIYVLTGRARDERVRCPVVGRGMDAVLTSTWRPQEEWCPRLQEALLLDSFRIWHASPSAQTIKKFWRSHEDVGAHEAVPFFWGSGLMVRPEDIQDTMEYASLNGLQGGGNGRHGRGGGVFQLLRWISLGMPSLAVSEMKQFEHFSRGHAYCNISLGVYKRKATSTQGRSSSVLMSSMLQRQRAREVARTTDKNLDEKYFPDRDHYESYEAEDEEHPVHQHPGHTGGHAGFQHLPFVCSVDGAVTWVHTGGRRGRWLPLRLPLKDIFSPKIQHIGEAAILHFRRPSILSPWSPVQWAMSFDPHVYLVWPSLIRTDDGSESEGEEKNTHEGDGGAFDGEEKTTQQGVIGDICVFEEEVAPYKDAGQSFAFSFTGVAEETRSVSAGEWWFGRRGDAFVGVVCNVASMVYIDEVQVTSSRGIETPAKHMKRRRAQKTRASAAPEQTWLFVAGIATDYSIDGPDAFLRFQAYCRGFRVAQSGSTVSLERHGESLFHLER